ncbi:MAG: D-alanine--D-alanine ligase [Bacilli bacterium]|nr:D-alanine--D-alanine ligase [Bacilli bacterium]
MKVKLGVMFGGETVEHEVSIISALQAIQNLNKDKYDVIPIYIGKNKVLYTGDSLLEIDAYKSFEDNRKGVKEVSLCKKEGKYYLQNTTGLIRKDITDVDVVLPIVHGNNVEDGTLAGFLDTIGIPYVGPHVLGAALGQDKVVMKQVMGSSGIPIVDYIWFFDNEYLDDKNKVLKNVKSLGYPVVVKPATLGSSVGITFVKSEKDIEKAIDDAISYDNKIVIEKAVDNLVEVNASVLGNYENQKVSPLEEVMGLDEILSYSDKYLSNAKTKGTGSKGMASTSRIIPARISKELTKKIQDTSKEVFRLLNLSGVCRIDYLIDKKTEKYYVNEPNTIPGSLSFYLWRESGVEYKDLLDEMISIAIKEYKNKSKKTMSFESNILAGFSGSKGTKGLKGAKGTKN